MPDPIKKRVETRGAARLLLADRSPELLIVGAAGTGKSFLALYKIHLMCLMNGACPKDCAVEHEHKLTGMRALMVRKTHKSLTSTGLVTFREQVAADAIAQGLLKWYGGSGEKPAQYIYSNGSAIVVGGMDNADKIMSAEYDLIFCVQGDTAVDSPSEIKKGYRRPYSGQIVTIKTARGHELTGTPNHPILTTRGWVALGALNLSDDVISRITGNLRRTHANPDVQDQPTPIADVVRALEVARAGRTERVVGVPMDFHGDGTRGYVDVVSATGGFHPGSQSPLVEHFGQRERERGDLESSFLMSPGAPIHPGTRSDPTLVLRADLRANLAHDFAMPLAAYPFGAGNLAGLGELSLPLGVSVPDVPERLPFRLSAWPDPPDGHLPLEPPDTDSDIPSGVHEAELSGEVAPDRVVELLRRDAPPGWHAYNLSTRDRWYYANNIITHNCQEATDFTLDDWEKCNSRLRNGRVSFQQLLADCNPQQPSHWLKKRCDDGLTKMLVSRHEDNPRYFDGQGNPTIQGADYMRRLDNLTGVRRERLRFGRWAAAEGMIYEDWRPDVHLSDRKILPMDWPRYWGIDFGYTNPFVWQMWAIDPDGRMYLEREIYRTKRLVEDHVKDILAVVTRKADGAWKYPKPQAIVTDHDAEDRATFERHISMGTTAANKNVSEGIQAMQARLRLAGDGLPRMFLCRDALVERDEELKQSGRPTWMGEEVEGYIWEPSPDGKPTKDKPLKLNDHSMDTARYVVARLDLGVRARVRTF